jgi:glycosyltransferase involved in cell wall biosynthesis
MRILHVTDCYPPRLGGIEAHVAALAAHQAALGDDVTVLTATPPSVEGRVSDDAGPVTVCRVGPLPRVHARDLGGFDVVHAHLSVVSPFSLPMAARSARAGVPTVVTVHSMWGGLGPIPGLAARLSGLRGASVTWTAVGQVAAQQLAAHLPPGTPVALLPNAVSVAQRSHTPGERGDGEIRLVSTMRVARRKRPLPLLRMFRRLRHEVDVPVSLTIVGDGPLRESLQNLVRRSRLEEAVRITGRVGPASVVRLLAEADAYVAPAVLESFGLAALEARCVGLPVVARADSGVAEFIEHEREGLLSRSDGEMVDDLVRLARDPVLRRSLAEHNRTTPSGLTWANTLRRHSVAYARACSGAEAVVLPLLDKPAAR